MNPALRSLLELAAASGNKPIPEDVSVEELYPELVAPIMRYESLLRKKTEQTINDLTAGLTKQDILRAKASYTKSYLISLDIPYDGIQSLCKELIRISKTFNLSPSQDWIDYADGAFDWENDIANMQS